MFLIILAIICLKQLAHFRAQQFKSKVCCSKGKQPRINAAFAFVDFVCLFVLCFLFVFFTLNSMKRSLLQSPRFVFMETFALHMQKYLPIAFIWRINLQRNYAFLCTITSKSEMKAFKFIDSGVILIFFHSAVNALFLIQHWE